MIYGHFGPSCRKGALAKFGPPVLVHRFLPDIVSYTAWLYSRFNLSHRDIEDLLTERGIAVSREAIRRWCIKFGAIYTRRLKRFFKRLLRSDGGESRKIVTDKLRRHGVAHRELIPETLHSTRQYENNRTEQSLEATRVRERGMRGPAPRRFKSVEQAQRFVTAHAAVQNRFNLGRHLVEAQYYRNLRAGAFNEWSMAVV